MGPESANPARDASNASPGTGAGNSRLLRLEAPQPDELNQVFFGPRGLRAGWSVLVFAFLVYFFSNLFEMLLLLVVLDVFHVGVDGATPFNTILGEGTRVAALAVSMAIMAALEHRGPAEYNLRAARRFWLLAGGVAAGFLAISLLLLGMHQGGWIRFGPRALAGPEIFSYALLWGAAFALVGLFEEGAFRCYLLSTFTRGMNFWWALGTVALWCLYLGTNRDARGIAGIYAVTAAGLVPCLWLHLRRAPQSGFWQAAWVTSAGFGGIHTLNGGENWIGVLAAAGVGFVFCVSVRVTGSAWWAIGCHTSWDWAESYFYGAADSGFAARGHLFTATPTGPALWSGGAAGPEGSVLVFPVMLVLLAALLALYRRPRAATAVQ